MGASPVDDIYVWVTQHSDADADMTIASMNGMPLISQSRRAANELKPVAENMAKVSGKKLKLMKYNMVAELDAT